MVRDLTVLLPGLEEEYLEPVTGVPDDELYEAAVDGGDWPDHRLAGGCVEGSRLTGVAARGSDWARVRLVRSVLDQCDFSTGTWTAATLDRVHVRGCRLTGLSLRDATLTNVVFEECRLDYAGFTGVSGAGVAFVDCVLTEAVLSGCSLPGLVLEGCTLDGLVLEDCDLSGADLRGSRLAAVHGLASLRGARVDHAQLADVAQVAARELALAVDD